MVLPFFQHYFAHHTVQIFWIFDNEDSAGLKISIPSFQLTRITALRYIIKISLVLNDIA
ncbi:MAG: hypothetical protein DID92_2727743661 [Candidatus Nitrotoga sp. SPKER]|nr:MAG: hypothetical protein DID92_2727743661 [Candidatus Nitrotoga sp. SPKER]